MRVAILASTEFGGRAAAAAPRRPRDLFHFGSTGRRGKRSYIDMIELLTMIVHRPQHRGRIISIDNAQMH